MPLPPSPDPNQITSRFEKLLVALARADLDFAVVGGVAVILNGYPRLTVDLDIVISEHPENIRRLLVCLAQWGEGWARELKPQDFAAQEGSVRVTEDFDLDIFTRMQGSRLDDFRPRLKYIETEGTRIAYLSPQDLIALKKDSWREKDRLDVAAMREIIRRDTQASGS
jgi:hypothetical protein